MHTHDSSRVLVIGTTADYIQWIQEARPGKAVYITAPEIRKTAEEPAPSKEEEILCNLKDGQAVIHALVMHLESFGMDPAGVVCFDCESMALAAKIANYFKLRYPSVKSIENCRHKDISKILWRESGVDCPNSKKVGSLGDLKAFLHSSDGPVVLKPSNGSGSELVFICDSLPACEANYATLHRELAERKNNRLYINENPRMPRVVAEAYVAGDEYSCDFLLQRDDVHIIRITEKIRPSEAPFGTVGGYIFPSPLPPQFPEEKLQEALMKAARALGLETCIGMADFIISSGRIFFLEITPRPGGDCLPHLLRSACGFDMLSFAMDVAAGIPALLPNTGNIRPQMGIRLHAKAPGRLKRVNVNHASNDSRILDVKIIRRPGHRIVLPPADYESWFLGHLIVELPNGVDPRQEYLRIQEGVAIEIENETDEFE